ncbi:MAG: type II toxin-antitoxin system PemK/MazF family toxin [Bacteroidetes bacterium]|nr:type II toxin-antitoxin system PemK/MazF family toxin [Bacteroidota bacterium]
MRIRKWSIYRADLDPVVGSEQGKSRPVLVISEDEINDLLNIVNVIPITSRKSGRTIYPNEVLIPANNFGLSNESIILCHQIRTLDKQRLTIEYGQLNDEQRRSETIDALCFQLGINRSIG